MDVSVAVPRQPGIGQRLRRRITGPVRPQRAALVAIAGLVLAPKVGALGAAIAQLLGFVLGFVVLSCLFAVSFRAAANSNFKV